MTEKEKNGRDVVEADTAKMPSEAATSFNKTSIKSRVMSGALWVFMEKGGLGVVEFIVAWILARFFLTPQDYSTVGLIAIFVSFSNIIVQGGFNTAIIQRKDLEKDDCVAVFWLSLFISVAIYIILFFAAPFIAAYYGTPIVVPILRVQAVTLITGALSNVQLAILTRELRFKEIFMRTSIATVLSAILSIVAAALGFGLWTIVIQLVSVSAIGMVILWLTVDFRPTLKFDIRRIKKLFGFGSKILASDVINCAYSNALPVMMDKLYESGTLGFYNKARTIPSKLGETITSTITNVVFPSLSTYQNDSKMVKNMTRKFISVSTFVSFAIMAGLIATAKPLILFVYTSKWAGSIVFMQFVCVTYAFAPMNSANLQAIKAMGRSDIYLKLEIIKNGIGIALLSGAMIAFRNLSYSLYIVLGVQAFISLLCVFINAFPNRKLIGYSFGEQIADVLPSFVLSAVMGAIVYAVTFLGLPNGVTLLIQVPLGVVIYVLGAKLFKFECFTYLLNSVKEFISGKRRAKK